MSEHHESPEKQTATHPTLGDALAEPLQVGEPDVSGQLAVYPIFGPEPALKYGSFAGAHGRGEIEVAELEGGASVNDLTVHNKGAGSVLLYEGEELLGAQQNRVLDISLLIAAETKTRIPVSCVEAGRWDGSRHGERFRPSRQAADPDLRKKKQRRARREVAAGRAARASQGEVWNEVSNRMHALSVSSPTSSMSDVYERRRDHLGELREPIRLHENQCGAICAIGGEISILDYVGRADVWADLHPALLEGYALDALRASGGRRRRRNATPPELATVRGFTLLACDVGADRASRSREAGIGQTLRFEGGGVAGSALLAPREDDADPAADELVQLTAYPDRDDGADSARGSRAIPRLGNRPRVNRPSARRPRRNR